jgi:hypothetical protein
MLAYTLKPEKFPMFQSNAEKKNRTPARRRPQVESCEGRVLLSALAASQITGPNPSTAALVNPTPTTDVAYIKHGWLASS